jgi:hypothetical protein
MAAFRVVEDAAVWYNRGPVMVQRMRIAVSLQGHEYQQQL